MIVAKSGFDDRPPVVFNALSIGIGSVPTTDGVQINGESLIKIKPMQTFLQRLESKVTRLVESLHGERNLKVAVVGSGVAGMEILFCLTNFLKQHAGEDFELKLVTRSKTILPSVGDGMRNKALAEIAARGHEVVAGSGVTQVDDGRVTLADGSILDADLVVWATGASAPMGLEKFGSAVDRSRVHCNKPYAAINAATQLFRSWRHRHDRWRKLGQSRRVCRSPRPRAVGKFATHVGRQETGAIRTAKDIFAADQPG